MASTNLTELRRLRAEFNARRGEIDRCTTMLQRMVLAKERKPLLESIEKYELLVESERVAAAVSAFEEAHPPATKDCPLCKESMRMGELERPKLGTRGEPYVISPCCAGIICKTCVDARIDVEDREGGDRMSSCPLCAEAFPPYGSEEYKRQILEHAEAGDAECQYHVGMCLMSLYAGDADDAGGGPRTRRYGFDIDRKEGLKWIKRAADQQHPKALCTLGLSHFKGMGRLLEKSDAKALQLLEQAANLGVPSAHDTLSLMYLNGAASPTADPDESQAATHATIAYALGVRRIPAHRLGMLYFHGIGFERNLVRAKHYLEEACMKDTMPAAYGKLGDVLLALGQEHYDGAIHINGHSCIPRTLYWWRKAVENGDTQYQTKVQGMEMFGKRYCAGCLRTAIDVPREPGIEQCPNQLQRCQRCKAVYYCNRECQRMHWKRGHKADCVDPDKDFADTQFLHVERFNAAVRATTSSPEEYEARRRGFAEALAQSIRDVGPPRHA